MRPQSRLVILGAVVGLSAMAVATAFAGGVAPKFGSSGHATALAAPHLKPKAWTPAAAPGPARPLAVLDPPPNDQCAGAIPIACGNISLSGNTASATNNYDFPDTTLSCTGYSAGGRDVVYSFAAQAGDSVWLRYQSTADASMYIVTDCSNVTASCVAGMDMTRTGDIEELHYGFHTTGTYYLILDSYGLDTFGSWTLIGQFLSCGLKPPPNDRCTTATPIFCGQQIVYSGSTQTAFNDYSFPSAGASCANSTAGGGDVAYVMSVNAGDSLSVSYTSTADGVLYILSACDGGTGSCVAGANATGVGGTEMLNYRFPFTGTYYLILDSDGANSFGNWTLGGSLMCSVSVPPNDQCSGAIPIYCGAINLSGSTALAMDDYDLPDTSCTGFNTQGADVVYRIDAAPGTNLALDYKSARDASAYIVTDCANVAGTCVYGIDSGGTGETEHINYTFPQRRTYYLILDSFRASDDSLGGNWTGVGMMTCPVGNAGVDGGPNTAFRLGAPAPNPFARSTMIRFTMPSRDHASLRIYDLTGRLVRTLVDGDVEAGDHAMGWDALDDRGQRVRVGTYFARLTSGNRAASRTIVFVR